MDATRTAISAGGVHAGPAGDCTMTRQINAYYDDEAFARQRDLLIPVVRKNIAEKKEKKTLEKAKVWLCDDFSPPAVRRILERERQMNRTKDRGTPFTPNKKYPINCKRLRGDGLPGNALRADRLEQSLIFLLGSNREGNPSRILGKIIPRKARRLNALRVIVVCGCIVDSAAEDWLGSITPLAHAPWDSDYKASPWIKGREDVFKWNGHDAMKLILEACDVLEWEVERDIGFQIHAGDFKGLIRSIPEALESASPPIKANKDIEPKPLKAVAEDEQGSNTQESIVEPEQASDAVAKADLVIRRAGNAGEDGQPYRPGQQAPQGDAR